VSDFFSKAEDIIQKLYSDPMYTIDENEFLDCIKCLQYLFDEENVRYNHRIDKDGVLNKLKILLQINEYKTYLYKTNACIEEIIRAASTAYNMGYYRVAYYLISSVDATGHSNYMKCVSLKIKILAISGQVDKAFDAITDYIKNNEKDDINHAYGAMLYGEVLLQNLPISIATRKNRLTMCICTLERHKESSDISIKYYLGLCLEELFDCDTRQCTNYEAAIEQLSQYVECNKGTSEEDRIRAMEAYWALARLSKYKYFANRNCIDKKAIAHEVTCYYSSALACVTGFPVYEKITKGYIQSFNSLASDEEEDTAAFEIMRSFEMRNIERNYYHNDLIRKHFVREKHCLDEGGNNGEEVDNVPHLPCLYVLQRWNSFTPILKDTEAPSRGGGYFIDTGRKGIAIDPGFDFIQNFREAGFALTDIDYIFITHAHNDHSADMEPLTSLLHDYNSKEIKGDMYSLKKPNTIYQQILRSNPYEDDKKIDAMVVREYNRSPRRKVFELFITPSTNRKFNNLDITKNSNLIINMINFPRMGRDFIGNGIQTTGSSLNWRPIITKHDDLVADACVGLMFIFEEYALVYTGDTGYDEDIKKAYDDIKTAMAEKKVQVMLLAHIGGFKHEERHNLAKRVDSDIGEEIVAEAFYKTHLGRLGIARLVEVLQPKLCVISEFGEEFRGNCRVALAKLYNDKIKPHPNGAKTYFVPADVGMELRFDLKINAINSVYEKEGDDVSEAFTPIESIGYFEDNVASEYPIYYYDKDMIDNETNLLKSSSEIRKNKDKLGKLKRI